MTYRVDVHYGFGYLSIRPRPSALYVNPLEPVRGDCKGCGAPWEVRPVETNAIPLMQLFESYNRCSYCKRPFKQ